MMNNILKALQEKNPKLNIKSIKDPAFSRYGQLHKGINTDKLIENVLNYVVMPNKGSAYEASIPVLESDKELVTELEQKVYGEMPIEIGLCYGWNSKLNGVEYHKGNEFNVAVTDLILMLGDYEDISFGNEITYNSDKIEIFYVEKGTTFEIYASCLHYSAIHVKEEDGFIAVIVLPKGTNEPLDYSVEKIDENRILEATNKWLILHPEVTDEGYAKIIGENITVNHL